MLRLDKYSYFLLDYDGLIADTEKLYFETWCKVLTNKGRKICHRYHEGKHESEVYEKVKPYLKRPMSLKEISKYRKSMFDKLVTQGQLKLIDGVRELLVKLVDIAPMSIVSNSTTDVVVGSISSMGIEHFFDNLFCFSNDVKRKPAPDLYNLAISTLNLHKDFTLALEDSISGILAAQEARIPVVCINSNPTMENFCKKCNIKYFNSANELLATF